jgi:general secretion pathway protein G
MIALVPALALLLGPVPDDAQAREALAALRKAWESAETLAVDFSVTAGGGGGNGDFMSGSVRLRGKDHWSISLQTNQGRRPGRDLALTVLSDGSHVVTQGRGSDHNLDPMATATQFRRTLPWSLYMLYGMVGARGPIPDSPEPDAEKIKDGGTETIDNVEYRIVQYEILIEGDHVGVRAWIDPKGPRLLKRELSPARGGAGGFIVRETLTKVILNGPMTGDLFVYASRRRLAQALAGQLGRSIALYEQFTGRTPVSLDDLVARPKELPEAVIFPAGGFVLGGVVPKDPWGRPYLLTVDRDRLAVTGLGADGKPGGSGDDEDIRVEVSFSLRMPVTAPTPRLRSQYEARLTMHLLVAAVKAFRETYGDLPRKKADLWDKPEKETVWPEGGWIPGKKMPLDPWGEEFRLITDPGSARVLVQDPKARLLSFKMLTAEERTALERASVPHLTKAEWDSIAGLVQKLRDDDLETREKADKEMRRFGPAIEEALGEQLQVEKDIEVHARLEGIRRSLPRPVPPWKAELGALATGIYGDSQPGQLAANERSGATTLKTLCSAEADFRANDRDWNHVNDFWTADVAGLYSCKDSNGQSIKLIEVSVALADAAPLEKGAAGGKIPALADFGVPAPKAGYWFRAMEKANDAQPGELLRVDTDLPGVLKMGKVHNLSRFGFCAYPAEYGASGLQTFIVNENNTIFCKDTQGEPVLEWPTDAELQAEWKKLD